MKRVLKYLMSQIILLISNYFFKILMLMVFASLLVTVGENGLLTFNIVQGETL